jgi:hypothetical protein
MRIDRGTSVVARLGNVLYWAANGLAALMATLGALGFVIALINNAGEGMILAPMMIALAVPVWLVGRACLYVMAGH